MAVRSLGQLTLDLVARTGGFVQGMDKAERRSQKWRRQVEKDLRRVGKAFGAAAVAATAGLAVMTKQGLSFVDSQAKLSTRLESSIDDLRALQIAASDFGIEEERLERSLLSFVKRLGDAERGTGEAKDALADLGLEASELARMPLADQMALIAERISQLDSAAAKASIADRLMTGGRRLVNLFNDGGDAIRAAVQEVDEYGLSLSRVDAQKVEAANDAMARIPRLLEPIKTQLAVAVADPLKAVTDQFLEAGRATGGFRDEVHGVVDDVVDSLLFVVDAVDGVNRAFQVAGAGIALFVLESQRAMMELGETIVDAPVDAINKVIEGLNKISPVDIEPVAITQISQDLDRELAAIERAIAEGQADIQRILMEPMASDGLRAAIESARNPVTLGGDGEGMINTAAIEAANTVAGAMQRAGDAANDSADADEEQADKSNDAAKAVAGLGDTATRSAAALQRAAAGLPEYLRDPRYNIQAGGETPSERARARFEATAFRPGDLSVRTFANDDTGRPTYSTALYDAAGDSMVQSVSRSGGGGAAATEGRHLGTLTLKSENGGAIDVQGQADELERWLADTLDGAAGGSR